MLLSSLWILLSAGPCDPPVQRALQVVCPYLRALQALDHERMAGYWAPTATSVALSGTVRPVDLEAMRAMRAFERGMGTRWAFQIDSVADHTVTVTLTEENAFYEALRVGRRTQTEAYVVAGAQIIQMRTLSLAHAQGEFGPAYTAFKSWLTTTEALGDSALMEHGSLRFDGRSAGHLKSWLRRWQRGDTLRH